MYSFHSVIKKVVLFSLILSFLLAIGGAALAEDVNGLYNQANKQLRQAQKDMFAGKNEKAVAALEGIRDLLARAKEADPNNPKVKTYENKYKKLVKDLERKTGQDLGGGSLTAAGSSSQGPALAAKPEAKPLPEKKADQPASAPAGSGSDQAKEVDGLLRQAEKSMHGGKTQDAVQELNKANELLAQIKASDPQNPKLSALTRKAEQLGKKLAAKTAKTEAAPAQQGSTPAAGQAQKSEKLPFEARRAFKEAAMAPGRIEHYLGGLKGQDSAESRNLSVKNADRALAHGLEMLAQARKLAAEKGMESHPDLDRVQAELDEAGKLVAQAKEEQGQAQAKAAAQAQEVGADVKAIQDLYQEMDPVFSKAGGNPIYYNDLPPAMELLKVIEEFEKASKARIEQALAAFTAKYGSTEQEIDQKTKSLGYSGQRAGFFFASLSNGLANVAKTREAMADDLVRKAKTMQETSNKGIHDFYRLANQAKIKKFADLAAAFQAENPRVKEFLGGLGDWMKKDTEALQAKVGKASWPKQASDAPGNASKLTKEGLAFLQKETQKDVAKGKAPRKVLDMVVAGPWRIFKKNVLGEVVQWGLPIYTAEEWESDKAAGLVRVYNMSLLTEEYKGVKKAPPFIGAAVGDSYYMKRSAIK